MANYLARVAVNGAASQPVARPSLIAPPILPGRPPAPEPGETTPPRMRPTLGQPAPPTGVVPRPLDGIEPPSAQTWAAIDRSAQSAPDEAHPTRLASSESTAPVSPPSPRAASRPADPNVVRAPRIRPAAAEIGPTPPRHFDFRPEPAAIVQLPRARGRVQPAASGEAVVNASLAAELAPIAAIATPAPVAEPVMPSQAAATATQIERNDSERSGDVPVERRIISVPRVGSGSTVVEMPVAGAARREPKITIGQIDVQVINTPSVAPQQPAPSPSTSNATNVELERVRWRPL